jgi:hypothetical protein
MISPDIGHLNSCDYEQVYEPAEDTFLLADILEADAAQLRTLRPKICVEIGYLLHTQINTTDTSYLQEWKWVFVCLGWSDIEWIYTHTGLLVHR